MNTELMTDDEIREGGLTDGDKKINNVTIRPVTALSLSWMQRTKVFDENSGDMLQKTAAFIYLHTAPKEEIRGVVNDNQAFWMAVDEWIDEHITHHSELHPYSKAMNQSLNAYTKSSSSAAGAIKGKRSGSRSKNS